MGLVDRLKNSWNAFVVNESNRQSYSDYGPSYRIRPDAIRLSSASERSIVGSIYNQIGIDVATISMNHVKIDENGQFLEDVDSGLQRCLNIEANLDQAATAFKLDCAITLCDEGVIAIVPTDTSVDPDKNESFDVLALRVGKITEWYPEHVRVSTYNQKTGMREEVTLPKKWVGIVENPLASVMNAPNSTLQRLIRKLNLLDMVDEQTSSGKLDLIFQLPYTVRTDTKRAQAEKRKKDIEVQLRDSKYGIAYVDSAEKITQLNRPAENTLLQQIEYLTKNLYEQLGVSEEVFAGTANEQSMLNYHNRTIEPIVKAITEEMNRKFLSDSARKNHERVSYRRNPFSLVPVDKLAEIADKMTRNEIMSSNEIRGVIGLRRSDDPEASKLKNSNINQGSGPAQTPPEEEEVTRQNGSS